MYKIIIICILLLTTSITNAIKISGGGNRGSSGARISSRTQQSNFRPQHSSHYPQQIGHYPQQSGHYPQQGGHYSQHPNSYHQPPAGHQGNFMQKPSSKGTFGKAFVGGALGAAAGLATFEIGKAILRSNSEPLRTPNGQSFYFDERNHQSKKGYFMCSVPLDDVVKSLQENSTTSMSTTNESTNSTVMTTEQFFKTVQFSDGSRPKSLTWNCKADTEVCCGTDCCPRINPGDFAHRERPSWIIFVSVLVLLLPSYY
ncbi:CX module family protein [Acanthocheilonema viteae]